MGFDASLHGLCYDQFTTVYKHSHVHFYVKLYIVDEIHLLAVICELNIRCDLIVA